MSSEPTLFAQHSSPGTLGGASGGPPARAACVVIMIAIGVVYTNLAQTLAMVDRSKEALAISDKSIEVARTTGQLEALQQIEEWLKHYQTEPRRAAEAKSPP